MKSASNVKGIDTIAVVIINVRMEVSSKGAPKSGKNGIGNVNRIQIPAMATRTFVNRTKEDTPIMHVKISILFAFQNSITRKSTHQMI
jgi:hypothetical protein